MKYMWKYRRKSFLECLWMAALLHLVSTKVLLQREDLCGPHDWYHCYLPLGVALSPVSHSKDWGFLVYSPNECIYIWGCMWVHVTHLWSNRHGRGWRSLLVETQEELESALHQVRVLKGCWERPRKLPLVMIPCVFSICCKICCSIKGSQQTHHGFYNKRWRRFASLGFGSCLGKADPWQLLKIVCSDVTYCSLPHTVWWRSMALQTFGKEDYGWLIIDCG